MKADIPPTPGTRRPSRKELDATERRFAAKKLDNLARMRMRPGAFGLRSKITLPVVRGCPLDEDKS